MADLPEEVSLALATTPGGQRGAALAMSVAAGMVVKQTMFEAERSPGDRRKGQAQSSQCGGAARQ